MTEYKLGQCIWPCKAKYIRLLNGQFHTIVDKPTWAIDIKISHDRYLLFLDHNNNIYHDYVNNWMRDIGIINDMNIMSKKILRPELLELIKDKSAILKIIKRYEYQIKKDLKDKPRNIECIPLRPKVHYGLFTIDLNGQFKILSIKDSNNPDININLFMNIQNKPGLINKYLFINNKWYNTNAFYTADNIIECGIPARNLVTCTYSIRKLNKLADKYFKSQQSIKI